MVLDRSPESFSPQLNSTSLFLCDPQGGASFDSKGILSIGLIKVQKEMLNTKYQSSNPFSFREKEF